jgi:predicted PurR-regulated permease PerM
MIRGRVRRPEGAEAGAVEGPHEEGEIVEIDAAELMGVFNPPSWLRDVGLASWLLVGVALLLVGSVWLLSLVHTIVTPVITGAVIAAVASPLVAWLSRHRIPRAGSAVLVLLGIIAAGTLVFVVVVVGITSQTDDLANQLSGAKDTLAGWLNDVGVDTGTAHQAAKEASSSASDAVGTLLSGISTGIATLSSLVFFLSLTALSLFFLLKDGPVIRSWGERHLGVPMPLAKTISRRTLQSLRGYFLGVTIVAAFNGLVVGLGAFVLGVPLAGTIAVITFVGAFVPYLGAWVAGGFSVLVALGGAGADVAAGMVVVQLLANGVLQQLVQPFAMGAALGIHPLAVLVVTIAGGCLFGAVGLILAAPLTAAATMVSADLARVRAKEEEEEEQLPARAAPT